MMLATLVITFIACDALPYPTTGAPFHTTSGIFARFVAAKCLVIVAMGVNWILGAETCPLDMSVPVTASRICFCRFVGMKNGLIRFAYFTWGCVSIPVKYNCKKIHYLNSGTVNSSGIFTQNMCLRDQQ